MALYKHIKKFYKFLKSFFPDGRDSIKRIITKSLYIIAVIGITVSLIYTGNRFVSVNREEKVISEYQEIWKNENIPYKFSTATVKNSDFKGWIEFEGTNINHPIFQNYNNSFYLNHSADKKESRNGSLLFDYRCKTDLEQIDRNLIIYGKDNKDSNAFSNLKKLRNIDYFRKHSTFNFSINESTDTYIIYSVFILNSSKEDDGGYIYNIYRKNFLNDNDFNVWVNEAKSRSVINTDVDVTLSDSIVTLVTDCDDFPDARLVVMAKKTQQNSYHNPNGNSVATANSQPLYPEKWYTNRGIEKQ